MNQKAMLELLAMMRDRGASDLVIVAKNQPQLRINGILEPVGTDLLSDQDTQKLAHSVMSPDQIEHLEENRSVDFSKHFENIARFRFNVFYQKDAVAIACRIIPFEVPPFEELGVPELVRDFALRPHGLVLITGPAGSGKSTTLAAMIRHINASKHVHVVCIEDPIEYLHPHGTATIVQREIGSDAHTFSEALRSVFRQTPDVIMIGEMRDLETFELALTLAETGHLILATLHTQDTTHSINRIVDIFPTHQQQQVYVQLSMVLQAVVSQQLIITEDAQRRVLACEVMNVNQAIRNVIREGEIQQIYSILQTGRAEGMMTMNESLQQLVQLNLISRDVAISRSPRPKELIRNFDRSGI